MTSKLKKIANIAPDIVNTFKRFYLSIAYLAALTILTISLTNDLIPEFDNLDDDFWPLLALGYASAVLFTIAGRLFNESRGNRILLVLILEIFLPLLVIVLMQTKNFEWFFPFLLPLVGIFWISISPFTKIGKGSERQEIQDKFWIVNHRAVASAIIAGVGFLVIALGLFAIERSLSLLFGLKVSDIFYQYLLPFAGLFLAPVFWLSTIEKLDEVKAKELEKPDFLSKAIGFLGQFLFVPFLIIYALILLAYATQIIFTQTLPVGVLGWMVLGFTIAGAVTWQLVYPSFMRQKAMVKLFHKIWFWLTIVPLALFAIAVYIRIDAYGFTPERISLVAGGVWAALLTLIFLMPSLRDIRLIPLLAGLMFLIISIGPFNVMQGAILSQMNRLELSLQQAMPATSTLGNFATLGNFEWSEESAKTAVGALDYLYKEKNSRESLRFENLLKSVGVDFNPNTTTLVDLKKQFKLDEILSKKSESRYKSLTQKANISSDLSKTPYYLGSLEVYKYDSVSKPVYNLFIRLFAKQLHIRGADNGTQTIELKDWIDSQDENNIIKPEIDFAINGVNYRLLVQLANLQQNDESEWVVDGMNLVLFSSQIPKAK